MQKIVLQTEVSSRYIYVLAIDLMYNDVTRLDFREECWKQFKMAAIEIFPGDD